MTFCIAWTTPTAAFLISDALLTLRESVEPQETSLFGELLPQDPKQYVFERAFKIRRILTSAFTFAGSTSDGHRVGDALMANVYGGQLPRAAFALARQRVWPQRSNLSFPTRFLYIYLENGEPTLTTFNVFKADDFEDRTIATVGSLPSHQSALIENVIMGLSIRFVEPRQLLNASLAFLQTFTLHDSIAQDGAGGKFTGIYIDRSGFHWQPDTLYCVLDSTLPTLSAPLSIVGSQIFDDSLYVISPTKGYRVYAGPGREHPGLLTRHIQRTVKEEAFPTFQAGRFEVVILLSMPYRNVVIIEMDGATEHKHFKVYSSRLSATETYMEIAFSPAIMQVFQQHETTSWDTFNFGIRYFAYEPPPSQDRIFYINIAERAHEFEDFAAKLYAQWRILTRHFFGHATPVTMRHRSELGDFAASRNVSEFSIFQHHWPPQLIIVPSSVFGVMDHSVAMALAQWSIALTSIPTLFDPSQEMLSAVLSSVAKAYPISVMLGGADNLPRSIQRDIRQSIDQQYDSFLSIESAHYALQVLAVAQSLLSLEHRYRGIAVERFRTYNPVTMGALKPILDDAARLDLTEARDNLQFQTNVLRHLRISGDWTVRYPAEMVASTRPLMLPAGAHPCDCRQ